MYSRALIHGKLFALACQCGTPFDEIYQIASRPPSTGEVRPLAGSTLKCDACCCARFFT